MNLALAGIYGRAIRQPHKNLSSLKNIFPVVVIKHQFFNIMLE